MKSLREQREKKDVKCTICLQKAANCSLDGCSHTFCLRCIQKWSKTRNTCPLCRNSFLQLRCRRKIIQVEVPQPPVRVQPSSLHLGLSQSQSRIIYVPMLIYPQASNVYFQTCPNIFMSGVEGSSNGLNYSFCSPTFFIPSM